jgi:DNA-binding NarL/FixJ family response regulator
MSRILIYDRSSVYRIGLRRLIEANIQSSEAIEAGSVDQYLSHVRSDIQLDLVLLDHETSHLHNYGASIDIRGERPQTRFAIISPSDNRDDILASLAAGFHGFISKHQSDLEILTALNDILSGRISVPRALAESVRPHVGGSGGTRRQEDTEVDPHMLTPRQLEVLTLLARGLSNKEISRALHIATGTTRIHVAGLFRALGVRNRTEAAFKMSRLGSIDQPQPLNFHAAATSRGEEQSGVLNMHSIGRHRTKRS